MRGVPSPRPECQLLSRFPDLTPQLLVAGTSVGSGHRCIFATLRMRVQYHWPEKEAERTAWRNHVLLFYPLEESGRMRLSLADTWDHLPRDITIHLLIRSLFHQCWLRIFADFKKNSHKCSLHTFYQELKLDSLVTTLTNKIQWKWHCLAFRQGIPDTEKQRRVILTAPCVNPWPTEAASINKIVVVLSIK